MSLVVNPYSYFTDTNGNALNGYLYIGEVGKNAENYPIAIFYDNLFTTPAPNPLTISAGYIYNGGTIAQIYASVDYSIVVKKTDGSLVYSSLNETGMTNGAIGTIDEMKDFVAPYDNYALNVLGYLEAGDGGGGTFYWDATSTETDNGGTIIQATGITTGRWKRVYSGAVNVKWFGAKGDGITDNAIIFNTLSSLSKLNIDIVFENGIYLSSAALILEGNNNITGIGKVIITQPTDGSNSALVLGKSTHWNPLYDSSLLASTAEKGTKHITLESGNGSYFKAGDTAILYSGESDSSSGTGENRNVIPINKEFVDIVSVSGDTLYLKAELSLQYHTGDSASIMKPSLRKYHSGTISNITFQNNEGSNSAYLHVVEASRNTRFINVIFNGYSAVGAATWSDNLVYDTCVFTGHSGMSQGRGIMSMLYKNCIYNRGINCQGFGGYFEEYPLNLVIDNCIFNDPIKITSNLDDTSFVGTVRAYPSIKILNSTINRTASNHSIQIWSTMSKGKNIPVIIDNCKIIDEGYLSSESDIGKAVIVARFVDTIKVTNCKFSTINSDSYPISVWNSGSDLQVFASNNDYGSATQICKNWSTKTATLDEKAYTLPNNTLNITDNKIARKDEASISQLGILNATNIINVFGATVTTPLKPNGAYGGSVYLVLASSQGGTPDAIAYLVGVDSSNANISTAVKLGGGTYHSLTFSVVGEFLKITPSINANWRYTIISNGASF